ncbi:hypothetical protein CcI49_38230 [Frankia sp. CcI49]|uniref:hypothetical protein n=1 Tax=Frankia sp. CcI49 TaxID=1745382 RepID=UPI000977A9EA|nr:hypothetical protein [Frankia sp. CcI49]ONH49752.1 hypothetical protein CcI49_38230 [Frankia sp. CcI49]
MARGGAADNGAAPAGPQVGRGDTYRGGETKPRWERPSSGSRPDANRSGPRRSDGGRPASRGGPSAGRPARRPTDSPSRSGGPGDGTVPRRRPAAPALPDEARAELLDRDVRRDLRSVPAPLAETIARHLVAAAMLVDTDPALALEHARAAAARLPRMAAVREAVGVAAYHAGEYAAALLELRAARRIDGSPHNLPLMADAERGLGRPERAVDCLSDPGVAELDEAARVELLIVVSGARRDMGQPEAAVVLLRDAAMARSEPRPWTPRLWYAYAEALLAADRPVEALRWFTATAAIDEDETDAAERIYELTVIDDEADDADQVVDDVDGIDAVDQADEDEGDEDDEDEVGSAGSDATPIVADLNDDAGPESGPDGVTAPVGAEPLAQTALAQEPRSEDADEGVLPGVSGEESRAEGNAANTEDLAAENAEDLASDEPADEPSGETSEVDAAELVDAASASAATGAGEPVPVAEPAVDFSAAPESTASAVAADSAAPIPEIVFSDAPGGVKPAEAGSRDEDEPAG